MYVDKGIKVPVFSSSATDSAPSDDSVMTDQDETVGPHRSPPLITNTLVSADLLHRSPSSVTNKDEPVTDEGLPSPSGAQIIEEVPSSSSSQSSVNSAQEPGSSPDYHCGGSSISSISPSSSVSFEEELQQPLTPLDETCAFKYLQVLGFGSYGLVWLVAYSKQLAAMKVLNTARINTDMIWHEVRILRMLDGVAFVTNLLGTMQFGNQLCLLLPLGPINMEQRVADNLKFDDGGLLGGTVFLGGKIGWRRPGMCMSELQFHVACLLIGLRNIHERNVVHRDIKPENILIGADGCVSFPFPLPL